MASAPPQAPPPTPISYAEAARFAPPPQPTFPVLAAAASIASLAVMSGASILMFRHLHAHGRFAPWVWVPFAFTIFGSTLGLVFEITLVAGGHAYQQSRTAWTRWIRKLRLLNLAPVTASIFFFVSCMVVDDPPLRFALLCFAVALATGLGFALYFGGAEERVGSFLLGIQVVQVILIVGFGPPGGDAVRCCLIAQPVLQLAALLVGTATPARSTIFHLLSTAAGVMLFVVARDVTNAVPRFSHLVAPAVPAGSLQQWLVLASAFTGFFFTARVFPETYARFRTLLGNVVWSGLYFVLVGQKRFPDPVALHDVYKTSVPETLSLKPYYLVHPQHLTVGLAIPAAEGFAQSVTVFRELLGQITKVFRLVSMVDWVLPQADARVPLTVKPRLNVWDDGREYWPRLFSRNLFGLRIPGNGLEPVPDEALHAFREGQLLAYLCESGVGSAFLARDTEGGAGALVVDLRFLEIYETKPDYEPYGGRALFQIDASAQRLRLEAVIPPRSTERIAANPADPAFRHAEALVLASLYYEVVSGKHLAEIHMTYNLIEVVMHNVFDVARGWDHPVRTLLYLHFFSHPLAEELTTEHLVQDRSVFVQVFSTTHAAMIRHLNDRHHAFHLGDDEDFEARAALVTLPPAPGAETGALLPNAAIRWELEYAAIWQRYARTVIEGVYPDDTAVAGDPLLGAFHDGLEAVLLNGLPTRYDRFRTRAGIARFLADTIHHCVVRHEVYGTTAVRAALDPRISQTQVPRDGGTQAIDEWRALACVALATSRARFVPLIGEYKYLYEGTAAPTRAVLRDAFDQLQRDLAELESDWTSTPEERTRNRSHFRPLPSEMDTGPGY